MGIGNEIYKKTEVGTVMTTTSSCAKDLEDFQDVFSELEALEQSGVLSITEVHRESQTGQRLVDLVRFKRIA